jgi:hypothetical protein
MLTSTPRVAAAIVAGMDRIGRVFVVLGFVAGAVTGAMAAAALLVITGFEADVHALGTQLLMAAFGAGGAVIGARVNRASGRTLLLERAADRA